MPRLVALDLTGGPRFVDDLKRVLDDGDAFLPLDQRLALTDRHRLARDLGASVVRTVDGDVALDSGWPVESGDAVVMATSGSTGAPKGVVLTRDALRASALLGSRRLACSSATHWLACLPVSHVGGLSVVFKAIDNDAALTVHEKFDAQAVTRAAHEGCTHVSLVPTALRRIDPSLFERVLLGGSRPPVDRPPHVIATYGLTETGGGVVYDGLPLDDVEIRIAHDGEILVRSPTSMRAYRDGSTAVDTDGWLHTGDVGNFVDGRLSVAGRLDDLIKTGGEKVWPDHIERLISAVRPDVDICVVGIDDPEWGQRVVLATTDPHLTTSEVREIVTSTLPAFHAPKQVVVLTDFSRTSIGKIRRGEIRREVTRLLAERE